MSTGAACLHRSHWAAPGDFPIEELTVGELLARVAAEVPDQAALVQGSAADRRRWTYRQLLTEARETARSLLTHFEVGERVAVWAPNCPEWLILEFATALAGLTLVTVNPSSRPAELAYILDRSHAAGLIHADHCRGTDMNTAVAEVAPDLPGLRTLLPISDWQALASAGSGSSLPAVRPDDTAQIQFTSGTTGRPKGVLLTHRALVNNARFSSQRVNAPFGSCWVNTLPMFHTGSCVTMALGALWRRACHVLVEQPDAGSILELLESEHADLLGAVPTILIALREHPTFAQRDLAALRLVISGGASVPVELVRRFETELGVAFCNLYGQTELSPVVAATRPDDCELDKAETVGRPLPHTECAIMDPASGEIVPIGAQGEVCVRGYQVMAGYDGSAQETAATIDDDRWLHTGDLGVMDERGYLRITGRLKDVIIRGGENIYPREVEERLMCHPAVGDAAVIGTPDDRWGEVVAAVIRLSPHAPNRPSPEDLRAWCRDALSPQKTPTSWFVVDELPLTASGKIMKHVLRDMARDNRLPALR